MQKNFFTLSVTRKKSSYMNFLFFKPVYGTEVVEFIKSISFYIVYLINKAAEIVIGSYKLHLTNITLAYKKRRFFYETTAQFH